MCVCVGIIGISVDSFPCHRGFIRISPSLCYLSEVTIHLPRKSKNSPVLFSLVVQDKFPVYVEAGWVIAILMEGQRRVIRLGRAWGKEVEERMEGSHSLDGRKFTLTEQLLCPRVSMLS